MFTPLVVAVTLGQRDLQLLALEGNQLRRVNPVPQRTGMLHQALRSGQIAYRFVLPDIEKPPEGKVRFEWLDGQVRFEGPENWHAATAKEVGLAAERDPELLLVPGVLWDELRTLKEELKTKKHSLARVLLFHTDRGPDSRYFAGEPHATAAILKAWLPNWLGMPPDSVRIISYLEANEDLKVKDDQGRVLLRPAAANRIDAALRETRRNALTATLRLHDSGGIPEVVAVLGASARLHFANIEYKSPTESADRIEVLPVRFTSVEELEFRRRTCDLIRKGQFVAAAAMTGPFSFDREPWNQWRKAIHLAAYYMKGYLTNVFHYATALLPENNPAREMFLKLVKNDIPRCLHVALRIEAALLGDDWLDAATLIVTFQDIVIFDAVDAVLRKDKDVSCIDWTIPAVIKSKLAISEGDLLGLHDAFQRWAPRFDWVGHDRIEEWISNDQLMCEHGWQDQYLFCAIDSRGRPASSLVKAIQELAKGLHKLTGTGMSPNRFRNWIMHGFPSQEQIHEGLEIFKARKLWIENNGKNTFLTDTLGEKVLKALYVADAPRRFQKLQQTLIDEIQSAPLA